MTWILKSCALDKTPIYMSIILFDENIKMLEDAMLRFYITTVMLPFFEHTKWD